jgi:hypothetical protein
MSQKESIISALNDNLRLVYRKAVDADAALNKLQSAGKGKFETIFSDEVGFTTSSKRFGPYVEELAGEVAGMLEADQEALAQALPAIVKKLEIMLTTLEKFKHSVK